METIMSLVSTLHSYERCPMSSKISAMFIRITFVTFDDDDDDDKIYSVLTILQVNIEVNTARLKI